VKKMQIAIGQFLIKADKMKEKETGQKKLREAIDYAYPEAVRYTTVKLYINYPRRSEAYY
jgi:hypothetical protein